MHQFSLPTLADDEYFSISPEGLQKLTSVYDPNDPTKNINWTGDYTVELPIRMKKRGPGSEVPVTLVEKFLDRVKASPEKPALTVKRENQWRSITFKQYFEDAKTFAQSLMALNITEQRSVNIIGFNSPEWHISFYGSIFGNFLPIGVYTTNGPEACHYLCEHSDCEVVIVENKEQLKKYLKIWDHLPLLKAIVIYNDAKIPENIIPLQRKSQIYQWNAFLDLGRQYKAVDEASSLENRMKKQKPGNCCTLVYTSGTTGQPKGVMLSHDNYIYPAQTICKNRDLSDNDKIVSYLPLSHVAAQMIDIIASMIFGIQIFFANPDALQGSLVETLKEIRPTFFFSVPRVWEKIEEKMKIMAQNNGYIKRSIATWAKGLGRQGTFAELHNTRTPICFGLAKSLVFNKVKFALGLDQCKYLMFGAAPLSPVTRDYFLSLNLFLLNAYGMSECSGATTISDPENFEKFDEDFLMSTGKTIDGTEIIIDRPDKDGNGEICYRGRHIFMGYYKNEEATRQTIDEFKFLHSGDIGKLDKNGNLKITGRIKELIITAGGENVAPVLIENEIKEEIKFVSNCMVIGDQKKFLSVLLTLKHKMDKDGQVTSELADEVISEFKYLGSTAKTVQEARNDKMVWIKPIKGSEKICQTQIRAISKAQHVRKWAILDGDFTIDGGELTPTLKLKRNEVEKKNMALIEQLYIDSKL